MSNEQSAPAQPPSQGGEAVEVVASIAVDAEGVVRDFTLEPGLDRHPGGYTVTSLMTVAQHERILAAQPQSDSVIVPRELRSVLAMILSALDRDAAGGKQVRGEMADELRALLGGE